MIRRALVAVSSLLAWAWASGQSADPALTQRPWIEARTACFHIYSCAPTEEVARLGARLEQFREAYALLAGAQAVASPPIVVMAYPDRATMRPFLPLYQGKPANLSAFFSRGSDQNLIVLNLSGAGEGALRVIFHEYTHLLLRHNQPYWPLWLSEGMAEIYATFEVNGGTHARLGNPIAHHLELLEGKPLLPLRELFAVTRESPDYNERERQGIFYAESWLLTHYLMLGGDPARQAGFRQLTPLLRQGQSPEQAFTNALHTTLSATEAGLRRYLAHGQFKPLELTLPAYVANAHGFATRTLTPCEVCYRLGEELSHIGRFAAAEPYFQRALMLAPASPLPYEGLGMLAARRGHPGEAVSLLHEAMQRGPLHYLAHYTYAREKYLLTSADANLHPLGPAAAAEIRAELQKSLALMPDFGPAHHLLGFFELVQGEDLPAAEKQIERSIQLEPENQSYLLTLAQVQLAQREPEAARRTLEPLCLRYVEPPVRAHAEEMIKALGSGTATVR